MKRRGRPKKPKGTGTVNISLRIDESLLGRLKRSSRESGHDNLSREIMSRLKASFVPKRDEDPAMRALCFLISYIAKQTSPPAQRSETLGVWRSNPFFFAAFKLAVAHLLDELTPPGEIIPPELPPAVAGLAKTEFALFSEMYESVEKLARQAYMGVRAMVELTAEQHAIMARGFAEEGKEGFYPDSLHWMPDAARDLAVNPQLAGQWRLK